MKNLLYRFDLLIKYLYIYAYEKKINTDFFKNLYLLHIKCINNFNEITTYENTSLIKCNENICINIFNNLIESIKNNGFNEKYPIPVGNNEIIINGAHRFAICFFYKINPFFIKNNIKGSMNYNYDFFINRNIREPLSNAGLPLSYFYCDAVALEQIKHDDNIRAFILFPVAYKDNDTNIQDIIKQYGFIYYKKKILLNKTGLKNLIKECYRNEKWIGGVYPTDTLSNNKTNLCYNDTYTTIYLIHLNDISTIISMKNKCRDLFNIGKNSLHVSDYQNDTFRIASALLNENSIHYLNNSVDNISINLKNNLYNYYSKIINNSDDYCVTSSAVLDIYGIRESKDLDYLHYDDNDLNISNISPHKEKWLSFYHTHKHDIIYNTENYFYFNGIKVATLNCIKNMKKKRNELKDIYDIQLINNINGM